MDTLSTLCFNLAGETIIINDRGNGCAGPRSIDATDTYSQIANEEMENEELTAVTEAEDAEAWELARDAFKANGLDAATIRNVALGDRAADGFQMIYAW